MDATKNRIIFFLSFIGIILSAYLIGIYYQDKSSFCDINATVSCTSVSNSMYSQLFGIPVAILGLLGYGFFALASFFQKEQPRWLRKRKRFQDLFSPYSIFSLALISLVFSLYLTYQEIFTLKTVCILCLLSQAIILVIFILAYQLMKKQE